MTKSKEQSSYIFLIIKLYMFRTVPLSIIRIRTELHPDPERCKLPANL